MPAKVTLKVVEGALQGQQFEFAGRNTCIMGRAEECQPRLPSDERHKTVSRRHCLLDINPPDLCVRDFGSLNGTFVNGENIGQRPKGVSAEEGAKQKYTDRELKQGDQVRLGDTVFQVEILIPLVCAECSAEIPDEQRSRLEYSPGIARCDTCRRKAEAAQIKAPPQKKARVCAECGQDVSGEVDPNRPGAVVCAKCRQDPLKLFKRLLELARSSGCDQADLVAIQGYRIERELGRGGMGAVYLARHEETGQQVALKVMLPQVAVDERSKKQFLRETLVTKSLNHPHVVKLYESGCSNGTFFFTLEFCDGGSLADLMERRTQTLSIEEAVAITRQALHGLEYAHQAQISAVLADGSKLEVQGVVHRDLKPHNLFLSGSGNSRVVKVGDFGLAKAFDLAGLSGRTRTGSYGGTLCFMPRQQIVNFKYAKPEVDVWAMAASLYYLLTGKFPRDFPEGQDPSEVILGTSAVPIRKRNAKIPAKLAEVIDQALIDKPQIGFKTAVEFRKALEGAV